MLFDKMTFYETSVTACSPSEKLVYEHAAHELPCTLPRTQQGAREFLSFGLERGRGAYRKYQSAWREIVSWK